MPRNYSRRGGKTTDFRQMVKGRPNLLSDAIEDFASGNPKRQSKAIESLAKCGSRLPLLMAGDMAIDLATRQPSMDDRAKFIDQANGYWRKVLDTEIAAGSCKSSTVAIRAGLQLAQLRAYNWFVLEGRLTPPDQAVVVYNSTLDWAQTLCDQKITPKAFLNKEDRDDANGAAAETCVSLLLKRFGILQAPGEWDALPSFISQDQGGGTWKTDKPKWDVSVFTQFDETPPALAHKVQVKHGMGSRVSEYAEDIAIVSVQRHLRLGNTPVSAEIIINECLAESGYCSLAYNPTQLLDDRTELLLERLDEVEKLTAIQPA